MTGALARRRAALLLPPLLAGVAALAIWQAVVVLGKIATFVLPSPTAIATAFGTVAPDVVTAATATRSGRGRGIALVIGLVLLAAGAVARRRRPATPSGSRRTRLSRP